MRILFVTQWFDPEPTSKGLVFARALAARGHEVEVLTGFPNYPGGKVYPGYAIRRRRHEVMDGIAVTRVALYPSHDRSPLRRIANYLSFALSASVLGAPSFRRPFDVIYAYWPPATIGIPAVRLSRLTGAPFVLEIQDMWPDTVAASGMLAAPPVLAVLERYCNWVYRRAAAISVISDGFARALVERGVPAEKVQVIHNWCDETALSRAARDPALAAELGLPADRLIVMFAGTMGTAQALDSVLRAAELCVDRVPRAHFVFVGGGVERAALEAQATSMPNVTFLPRQPLEKMPPLLALADALLVHLRDDPLFAITIPSKTQSSLASGRPLLMAVRGDAATMVERAGAGISCAPEDPEALVQAVSRLEAMSPDAREEMGRRGAEFYARELSMSVGVRRFEQLFARTARGGGAAGGVPPLPPRPRYPLWQRAAKRAMDVVLAAAGLVVAAPLMLLVGAAIRLTMGGPVLFRHVRPGIRGEPFQMVKFRTMRDAVDAHGRQLPDGERLTRLGTLLRRSSLDELPGLWNVLRGDMSLVGPRPLLMRYTPYFTARERLRLTVRPGITGLAQIMGRNEVRWTSRLAYDAEYVEQWSLALDLSILRRTVSAVLSRRGVVPDANSIMRDLDDERRDAMPLERGSEVPQEVA